MFYLVSEDELEKFLWQLSKSLKPFFNILFWASRQLGITFSHPQPSKSKIELNSGSNHRFHIQTRIIFMQISFNSTIFKTKNISWSCIQITQRMFQQNKIVFFLYLYPQCLLFGNVPQKFSIFRQNINMWSCPPVCMSSTFSFPIETMQCSDYSPLVHSLICAPQKLRYKGEMYWNTLKPYFWVSLKHCGGSIVNCMQMC